MWAVRWVLIRVADADGLAAVLAPRGLTRSVVGAAVCTAEIILRVGEGGGGGDGRARPVRTLCRQSGFVGLLASCEEEPYQRRGIRPTLLRFDDGTICQVLLDVEGSALELLLLIELGLFLGAARPRSRARPP